MARNGPAPEVVVFADDGDRRAMSLAMAVCDVARLARSATVYSPSDPDAKHDGPAPNEHVFSMAKDCRALIL
jgi:hypothetical protein